MDVFIFSFFAGVLTVLAPCVLPLLPLLLAGGGKSWKASFMVVFGLGVSVFFFTLLIRTGTLFFDIPESVWKMFSAGVIFFFGITLLFPTLWERISSVLGFNTSSQGALLSASQKEGLMGRFLLGASLAPVFSSCSPTYFLILGTVLPQSFSQGIIHLFLYVLGLSIVLGAIVLWGQLITKKLLVFANPNGSFKKWLGVLFVLLAGIIALEWDKKAEAWLLQQEWYWNSAEIELSLQEAFVE